jgi:hypothetical protein
LCLNSSYITFQSTPLNYAILTIFSDLYKSWSYSRMFLEPQMFCTLMILW